ncbi:MAG: hypothetical protein JHC93_01775 [Parachlamydiales bacterium]|nr:hypothetical protein [Parachlamydiales bacterium]
MTALQKITTSLNFSETQLKSINLCLDDYLNQSLISTVGNAFYSVIGHSNWQSAKQSIYDQIFFQFYDECFFSKENAKDKTAKVSEFVLRYLITEVTIEQARPYYSLSKDLRDSEKLWDMELPEMLLRASYGNGSTLPKIDPDLIKLMFLGINCRLDTFICTANRIAIREYSPRIPENVLCDAKESIKEVTKKCEEQFKKTNREFKDDSEKKVFSHWGNYNVLRIEMEKFHKITVAKYD